MAGTCEYGNELSGSIKCGEFLELAAEPVSFSRRTLRHGVSKQVNSCFDEVYSLFPFNILAIIETA